MRVSAAKKDLKDMLREGVRDTIRQTLGSVIQDELVRLEKEQAIQELRRNGKRKRSRR